MTHKIYRPGHSTDPHPLFAGGLPSWRVSLNKNTLIITIASTYIGRLRLHVDLWDFYLFREVFDDRSKICSSPACTPADTILHSFGIWADFRNSVLLERSAHYSKLPEDFLSEDIQMYDSTNGPVIEGHLHGRSSVKNPAYRSLIHSNFRVKDDGQIHPYYIQHQKGTLCQTSHTDHVHVGAYKV